MIMYEALHFVHRILAEQHFRLQFSLHLMHQSIPPALSLPPPRADPRADPRALAFFGALDGKFPGVGTFELSNLPGWGRKKRTNAPFSINHCVK